MCRRFNFVKLFITKLEKTVFSSTFSEVIVVYDEEHLVVEVLLYVHRNHRFIKDWSPGRPPRLSHSS